MVEDQMGYNAMVEGAMRSVVRQSLEIAAKDGLPGEHHFYVTFRTDQEAVSIPDHLHKRYPREMTIVLQHQFWNLAVTEDALEVDLSFNQKLERLHIPLDALITFADPSVNFGLQFQPIGVDNDEGENNDATVEAAGDDTSSGEKAAAPATVADDQTDDDAEDDNSDNVVTLDTFRKK